MGVRPNLADRFGGGALVGVVGIGIHEEDGHRLDAPVQQIPRRRPYLVRIQRGVHMAVGQDPLLHFDAQIARHDRFEHAPEAPGFRPVAAAHLD